MDIRFIPGAGFNPRCKGIFDPGKAATGIPRVGKALGAAAGAFCDFEGLKGTDEARRSDFFVASCFRATGAVAEAAVGGIVVGAAAADVPSWDAVPGRAVVGAAAATGEVLAAVLSCPGARDDKAAFMRFPTLDPLRSDTVALFSDAPSVFDLRASEVAFLSRSRKAMTSSSDVLVVGSVLSK